MASLDPASGLWTATFPPNSQVGAKTDSDVDSCYDPIYDTVGTCSSKGPSEADSEDSGAACGGASSDETNNDSASSDEGYSAGKCCQMRAAGKCCQMRAFEQKYETMFRKHLPPPIRRTQKQFDYISGKHIIVLFEIINS